MFDEGGLLLSLFYIKVLDLRFLIIVVVMMVMVMVVVVIGVSKKLSDHS